MARISEGGKDEPAFRGRLMDDQSGAGQGAGTLLLFDTVEIQALQTAYQYPPELRGVPFILHRAKEHGALAFVLVKYSAQVWICTDMLSLTLGRFGYFDNYDKPIRHEFDKWDFLPTVLRKYKVKPIFNTSV